MHITINDSLYVRGLFGLLSISGKTRIAQSEHNVSPRPTNPPDLIVIRMISGLHLRLYDLNKIMYEFV